MLTRRIELDYIGRVFLFKIVVGKGCFRFVVINTEGCRWFIIKWEA